MNERVIAAWHEAGHALVARALDRGLQSVSLTFAGGLVRNEPLPADATDEEIERALVVVLAGSEAEQYAPRTRTWHDNGNGRDPWLTPAELDAVEDAKDRPSDQDVIEHYTKRIGAEAVERARELAAELIERNHVVGQLEQLADELLMRDHLDADDVERLLA